jgi:glycyl-tRNA synthetase
LFLAVLVSCYRAEVVNGEKRQYFSFPLAIAPVKIAIFPLLKNKPDIVSKARNIFDNLLGRYNVEYDSAGAIGRRYRRADEAGTPFCVTIDFDSLEKNTVTVRYRDSMKQITIEISELDAFFSREFGAAAPNVFSWNDIIGTEHK